MFPKIQLVCFRVSCCRDNMTWIANGTSCARLLQTVSWSYNTFLCVCVNLCLPRFHLKFMKNLFTYICTQLWNRLSTILKLTSNVVACEQAPGEDRKKFRLVRNRRIRRAERSGRELTGSLFAACPAPMASLSEFFCFALGEIFFRPRREPVHRLAMLLVLVVNWEL